MRSRKAHGRSYHQSTAHVCVGGGWVIVVALVPAMVEVGSIRRREEGKRGRGFIFLAHLGK
jgi:hypothetical protein